MIFGGVQSQMEDPPQTVDRALQFALESLKPANPIKTSLCSRTDKGVHALMNAVHTDLEHKVPGETFSSHAITQGMNNYFKENNHEILTIRTSVVPDTFLIRQAAKWRSYIYRLAILKPQIIQHTRFPETKKFYEQYLPILEINRCHVVDSSVDVNKVKETLKMFHGVHDFTCFTKNLNKELWRSPIRCIDKFDFYRLPHANFLSDPQYENIDMWEFYVQSKAYLQYQVRKMIAAALAVGNGQLTTNDVALMLEKPLSYVGHSPKLMPPGGLFLSHIEFNEKDFVSPSFEDVTNEETDSS